MASHGDGGGSWILVLAARGKTYEEAAEALENAADKVEDKEIPTDKRIQLATFEPGGGGPYEQRFIMVPIVVEPLLDEDHN